MNEELFIEYSEILKQFEIAETKGNRLRIGELETTEWLEKEGICQSKLMQISKRFGDPRIFIIAEGDFKGLYIYSKQQEQCIKYSNNTQILMID